METNVFQRFSLNSVDLCNLLYIKEYDYEKVNAYIDELNACPYKTELFVEKNDASALITALCLNIRPRDESLCAKTSHLMNSLITKQNLQLSSDYLWKVISWHIKCLRSCNEIIMPDILHNMQYILQFNPQAGYKFMNDLVGNNGILINVITSSGISSMLSTQQRHQMCLMALKCIASLTSLTEDKGDLPNSIDTDLKDCISSVLVNLIMKGSFKTRDEFLYCKLIITALRVLAQIYFNGHTTNITLPEVIGISRYFLLYGLINNGPIPEKIMPAHQTIAAEPVLHNSKGGKKQKLRKPRNKAIEVLKKEIPVSDQSLMKDIASFENNAAYGYRPVNQNYLEHQKNTNLWSLTSDSDMSDIESSREAKLVALKSRVRQSASNLLLVLVKVTEKKDMFGYWWALLPDSPDVNNWMNEDAAKKTLAYCAVTDPISASRAAVLSVTLALLSGSKMYLSQAETSKKDNASFTAFSVSLGYIITCLHKVLVGILDIERSHAVIVVALKCCAALVQATPYHKMKEGLVSELVRSTRKFLVHRDVTLQVGALITMGCVLSIDPKIDEVLKSIEKDSSPSTCEKADTNIDSCDDLEEGYSDDEMFTVNNLEINDKCEIEAVNGHYFKTWVLDICFKNMGWLVRGKSITKCKQAAIPITMESLQVVSAVAFHHMREILQLHLPLVADVLSEMLQHDHQDVILQAARTVSIVGDAIQKLEQTNDSPPLHQCIYMWEKFLTPLSTILQCHDNTPAKAVVCDCVANVGDRVFKELPRRTQMLWCSLMVGTCSDEAAAVRAAAVRALAVLAGHTALREDICFISDCGESILRALAEPSLVVKTKAAWALGTLSDALVLNMKEPDFDTIDDDLLHRLLEVSIRCASDNDKVKMSATRGLGNLLRLIRAENLRAPQIKALCESAIRKLLDCACKGNNMKVRWNACYAIGNAMNNDILFSTLTGWQEQVFPSLCLLSEECKNLKVRINAACALRCTRAQYGGAYAGTWRGVLRALHAADHIHDYTEYKHKDNLIEQLCVTLAHLCCALQQSDLPDILDSLVFYYECAKSVYTQLYHKLPPENASCMAILRAAKYVTVDLVAETEAQQQALGMLQDIFIWDM